MSESNRMSISGEGIANLGTRLAEIANYLQEVASPDLGGLHGVETYGFPTDVGTSALKKVLCDHEKVRRALCKDLHRLRGLADGAGDCYVRTETAIDTRNRGLF